MITKSNKPATSSKIIAATEEQNYSNSYSSRCNYSYVPVNSRRTASHKRHESALSVVSVSSYGHVINPGSTDTVDYGVSMMPSIRERSASEGEDEDHSGDGGNGMSLRSGEYECG